MTLPHSLPTDHNNTKSRSLSLSLAANQTTVLYQYVHSLCAKPCLKVHLVLGLLFFSKYFKVNTFQRRDLILDGPKVVHRDEDEEDEDV